MEIKTIIFDFGGVITDSPIEGFKKLEQAYGISKGVIEGSRGGGAQDRATLLSPRFFDRFLGA